MRLGSAACIRSIVDEFAVNCASDPRINRYFFAVSSDPQRLTTFKHHLVNQICVASGGPCEYKGRPMKSAHAGMKITDEDFNAFVEDLVGALTVAQIT